MVERDVGAGAEIPAPRPRNGACPAKRQRAHDISSLAAFRYMLVREAFRSRDEGVPAEAQHVGLHLQRLEPAIDAVGAEGVRGFGEERVEVAAEVVVAPVGAVAAVHPLPRVRIQSTEAVVRQTSPGSCASGDLRNPCEACSVQ